MLRRLTTTFAGLLSESTVTAVLNRHLQQDGSPDSEESARRELSEIIASV
jgi:hypothetical protein